MTNSQFDSIPYDISSKKQIIYARRKHKTLSVKWLSLKSDDERLVLLLDAIVDLNLDLDGIRNLRNELWHSILTEAYKKGNPDWDITYKKYLRSKAWTEKRNEFFSKFGVLCICGQRATELHHKTYINVGREDIEKDLAGLCKFCHNNAHNLGNIARFPELKRA